MDKAWPLNVARVHYIQLPRFKARDKLQAVLFVSCGFVQSKPKNKYVSELLITANYFQDVSFAQNTFSTPA